MLVASSRVKKQHCLLWHRGKTVFGLGTNHIGVANTKPWQIAAYNIA